MSDEKNIPDWQRDSDTVVEESRPKLKKPRMFQVVLLNDDYTPIQFVLELISQFFYNSLKNATPIILKILTKGKGVCGIYTEDVAETKAAVVNQYSMDHQHPLLCEIEPCDDEEES